MIWKLKSFNKRADFLTVLELKRDVYIDSRLSGDVTCNCWLYAKFQ